MVQFRRAVAQSNSGEAVQTVLDDVSQKELCLGITRDTMSSIQIITVIKTDLHS